MAKKPTDWAHTGLRMREALRQRLEQAAKKNGVSLNQEMLNRIEASFGREETERKLVGQGNKAAFLKMLSAGIDVVEEDTRGKVFQDDRTTAQVRALMLNLFSMYRGIRNISNLVRHAGHDFPVSIDSVLSFLSVAYSIDRQKAREYLTRPYLPNARPELTIEELALDLNARVEDVDEWVRFLGIEPRETERGRVFFPGHRNWIWYVQNRRRDGADYETIRREMHVNLHGSDEEWEAQRKAIAEERASRRKRNSAELKAEPNIPQSSSPQREGT